MSLALFALRKRSCRPPLLGSGLLVEAASSSLIQTKHHYSNVPLAKIGDISTAFAISCFANAIPRAIGDTKTLNDYGFREARWAALRPNSVWTSEASDNLNAVQRDRNNPEIIVVHPLYVDLGSVDRGNYFPEFRRP